MEKLLIFLITMSSGRQDESNLGSQVITTLQAFNHRQKLAPVSLWLSEFLDSEDALKIFCVHKSFLYDFIDSDY